MQKRDKGREDETGEPGPASHRSSRENAKQTGEWAAPMDIMLDTSSDLGGHRQGDFKIPLNFRKIGKCRCVRSQNVANIRASRKRRIP